jgi:hypothetical protein
MSTLLVGGSGVGKNTAINGASEILDHYGMPVIGGKTMETISDQLYKVGVPACAVLKAEELSDFLGKKDYQQGMVQGLTNLLDNQPLVDITVKSDGTKRRIQQPTLTILAGSTPAWLHTGLPADSMDGGFFPRFAIICDNEVKRHVPLIKKLPPVEVAGALDAKQIFFEQLDIILKELSAKGEYDWSPAAEDLYMDWYVGRTKLFSQLAQAYAHRCRDHVIRFALLSAISRQHSEMDLRDVEFALDFVAYIAERVDGALAVPNQESIVAHQILEMLPASREQIFLALYKQFPTRTIRTGLDLLHECGLTDHTSKQIKRKENA